MAITIKHLKDGTVPVTTAAAIVDAVATGKTVIVKNMRFVNTGSGVATLNVYFKASSGGTGRRILPKDLSIAPGALIVEEAELTLEAGNLVEAVVPSGNTVDYVISGIERDA